MTPIGNLVFAVAQVLDIAINFMFLLLLARVILSWIQPNMPSHPITQVLYAITEPLLNPVRRLLNRYTGNLMIDLSPVVGFLALLFLQSFLVRTLYQIAQALEF